MPVLPYQQQVGLSGGSQQPYGQAAPVSDAIGRGLSNLGGSLKELNDAQMQQQNLHDEAAVNDLYSNSFSPAIRKMLYDPNDGYFSKQGKDALNAYPQVQQLADAVRGQARGSLQNENQQRIFDNISRKRLEIELDGAARHADQQSHVWQAQTSDAVLKNQTDSAVDHFNDPKYTDGAIASGLYEIQRYGAANGQSSDLMAERSNQFVRGVRTAIVQRLLASDPVAAQSYLREHASEFAGPNMGVLEHQVSSAVKPVEASSIATTIVKARQQQQLDADAALSAQKGEFGSALQFVLSREGGYNASDGNSGAPVKYGINQKANPDIDVKSLTLDKATQIYKDRYWNAIGGDSLPRGVAIMAMDAAVNQGVPFAKQLIADSGGDVTKMAQLRRDRYEQIIANDPSQAKYRDTWMGRVDAAQQSATNAPQTSARDMRAQMADLIADGEARAEQSHPGDPLFRDMVVSHVKGQLTNAVASQQAVQEQAHSTLTGLAIGAGKGSARPTTLDDLLALPGARQAWSVIPPESQKGMLGLIEHNAKEATGTPMRSDPATVQDAFRRIHLPDDDPAKITYKQQLVPLFGKVNKEDYNWLGKELDDQQSVSGRSLTKDLQTVRTTARGMLARSMLGGAQPEVAEEASYRFSNDLQGKVDAYVKAGKDPRTLLTPGTPDYVLKPESVMSYLQTPQQAVAAQAAAISASASRAASGKVAEAPAKVASDAEYEALPKGAVFIGPDGKRRTKP